MSNMKYIISIILFTVIGIISNISNAENSGIRYDGVYKAGEGDLVDFLRFYRDGSVILASSYKRSKEINKWFTKEGYGISIGKIKLDGEKITFSIDTNKGFKETFDYTVKARHEKIRLSWHQRKMQSNGSRIYTFVNDNVLQQTIVAENKVKNESLGFVLPYGWREPNKKERTLGKESVFKESKGHFLSLSGDYNNDWKKDYIKVLINTQQQNNTAIYAFFGTKDGFTLKKVESLGPRNLGGLRLSNDSSRMNCFYLIESYTTKICWNNTNKEFDFKTYD